ncbi:MAG: phosphatidate cytidylyltransferase [Parvicellaceae bacterium]|jgi:phosphatidate cytidylyltransferase|nr:MAG: Phosphatidate cytidylyltransferase [Crocinitomicaceae bacterium]|tara:strand:+ start:1674 stop:2624 length:951 start_codon:yes stop_codon:yes gene_type:complete
MDKLIENINISGEIQIVIFIILAILVFSSIVLGIWGLFSKSKMLTELKTRTKSWWIMCTLFITATIISNVITYVCIGFLSFAALREFYSVIKLRKSDRAGMLWCYLAIPVQYYLAYRGWYELFIVFIPVFMFVWIPFILVLQGETKMIMSSMAGLPTSLMLCVFGLSHMAYLISLPEIDGFSAGGKGLLLFLIFITQINDVMQFIWGKLIGKHKILPKISPNKTWGGFIGGLISSVFIGYLMSFLTPLNHWQVIVVSFFIAGVGFVGDVVVSAIKRDMGVKDMGQAIPGHGGVLDRIDSLALTTPIFFHLVYFFAY